MNDLIFQFSFNADEKLNNLRPIRRQTRQSPDQAHPKDRYTE